jgi:hypothetical protein
MSDLRFVMTTIFYRLPFSGNKSKIRSGLTDSKLRGNWGLIEVSSAKNNVEHRHKKVQSQDSYGR